MAHSKNAMQNERYQLIEITVKASGTKGIDCDYTDIRSALDSINDNSSEKRYVVRVLNGTYDVSDDGELYLGMKNYVDIVGQSRGGVVVIKRDSAYSAEKATFDPVCYKHPIEYASLRNMTIVSKNAKCPVHIDNELLKGTIEIIDCNLINENTPDMENYQNGLACGLRKGQRVVARGVWSNGVLWAHNGTEILGDEGCRFELYNCISKYIQIGDLVTYGKDVVVIEGCKAEFLRYKYYKDYCRDRLRPYRQSSFTFELRGNCLEYIEAVTTLDEGYTFVKDDFEEVFGGKWSICEPSIHQFCKNEDLIEIQKGDPVTLSEQTDMNGVEKWRHGEILYGIALDKIPVGGFGVVQYNGIVEMSCYPHMPVKLNEALELDSSGILVEHKNGKIAGYAKEILKAGSGKLKIRLTARN